MIALFAFGLTSWWDFQTSERQEIQENLRFVRQMTLSETDRMPLSGLNLTGVSLRGLELRGADLAYTTLARADCSYAILSGAILADANLQNADLGASVLTDSVVTGANLNRANFSGAILRGADLSHSDLGVGVSFRAADLRGADLTGLFGDFAGMMNADLREAVIVDTSVGAWDLRGADLTGATIKGELYRPKNALTSQLWDAFCWDETTLWPVGFDPPPSSSIETCKLFGYATISEDGPLEKRPNVGLWEQMRRNWPFPSDQ